MPSKIGVFPGSFDPFTKGHESVVRKSLDLFDHVIIAIGVNQQKKYLFNLDKRVAHIQSIFEGETRISIQEFNTLTVNLCKENGAKHIIRGLRNSQDFEYEKSIAHMNFDLEGIKIVFFLTNKDQSAISSSIVREIYKNDGAIEQFVTNAHLLV